ncbi:E3 ubiquitin-protein ligase synoviolin [Entomortierella parvispora]|uniref:RING-type E3 ubiquitin transferase n=1 Tax=Entomortierella parvispora TaxID=205924 RepID=A0A9P3H8C1_9FUNG|nr:E3 ubiquitin-protein ligase synoviolin [Entomortierella parvispora]
MARLAVYGAISTVLAGGVIAGAFAQRSNFYAACIYLYKSNACMMIILNLGLFLTIIAGQLVQMIFFGNLRTLEVEHLYERAWYAVTETCLAMTIFKDEFDTRFVVMFTVLLFLKVFHWLCQDRVDSMEQSPEIPMSFHIRMVTMIGMLVSLDVFMALNAADHVALKGPNMMIMFGFEYTLLATSLLASFGKYVLHTIDMRREEPWENKSMLLFYLDLVADFVKLVTYLMFFMVILVCYGLPLHIIRDVYMTMRSFFQKCKDLIQYRKATRNMNERYPDASPAELAGLSDPICIICREEMQGHHPPHTQGADEAHAPAPAPRAASGNTTNVPKKLPCGHIFHFHCLKSWLERQQSCPTCRRLVLDPPTPAPTPQPAPGDAAPGGAAAAAPGTGPQGGAGGPAATFGHFGHNHAQQPPGLAQNQGMGYPMYAPNGHNPLAAWHPHAMGGLPGAIPQEGNQGVVGSSASVNTGGGGASSAPHSSYIPSYSIPHATHPIPGFIPLFPVGDDQERAGYNNIWAPFGAATPFGGSTQGPLSDTNISSDSNSSRTTHQHVMSDRISLTSLDTLTDDQIKYLEENTRRGLQERLRILQAVDRQIAESVSVLSRVLDSLPPAGTPAVAARSTAASSSLGADPQEFADPPSPVSAEAEAEAVSTKTNGAAGSARNWMHGGAAGLGSASSMGLQSSARDGLERALSTMGNGTRSINIDATDTASPPVTNGSNPTGTTPSSTVVPTFLPSPSVSPLQTETAGLEEQNNSAVRLVDKGKGKKTEAELEEDALREKAEREAADNEDEDSNYSPQEMVRRRWARMDVSPSE